MFDLEYGLIDKKLGFISFPDETDARETARAWGCVFAIRYWRDGEMVKEETNV